MTTLRLIATLLLAAAHLAAIWLANGRNVQLLASTARLAGFTTAMVLGGCASLPDHVERPHSQAYGPSVVAATTLGRIAQASLPPNAAELSGFRLLPDGGEAFEARLALIRRAEKSIDVQYYLIADDQTGQEFLGALSDAAAHGVRVRVLVDDLYATGQDELWSAMAAKENVEVRLFNPLPVRGGSFARRIFFSMHEFSRINHRMHNKLLVVDGVFAVTGGRNIADEYFERRAGDGNFIDMDLLIAGTVVPQMEDVFDGFWTAPNVYPASLLLKRRTQADRFSVVERFGTAISKAALALADDFARGRLQLTAATADLVADKPHKTATSLDTVARRHRLLLAGATSSVNIASPYFVPDSAVLDVIAGLRSQHVAVNVLTNSSLTTDAPLVHVAYARRRVSLAESGVRLYELKSAPIDEDSAGRLGFASLGRLHSKVTVVDRTNAFVGSMNMDARSAHLNTELAIIIHSATLASELSRFILERQTLRSDEYRLVESGSALDANARGNQRPKAVRRNNDIRPGLLVRALAYVIGEAVL